MTGFYFFLDSWGYRGGAENAKAENAGVENSARGDIFDRMRQWKTGHQNSRMENSRCDINYIILPEKHVDIIGFKPE